MQPFSLRTKRKESAFFRKCLWGVRMRDGPKGRLRKRLWLIKPLSLLERTLWIKSTSLGQFFKKNVQASFFSKGKNTADKYQQEIFQSK